MNLHVFHFFDISQFTYICQLRVNLIPTLPGSDWRDIPNKKTFLPSGQIIQPLLFPYEKSYFNEKTKKKETVSALFMITTICKHKETVGIISSIALQDPFNFDSDLDPDPGSALEKWIWIRIQVISLKFTECFQPTLKSL